MNTVSRRSFFTRLAGWTAALGLGVKGGGSSRPIASDALAKVLARKRADDLLWNARRNWIEIQYDRTVSWKKVAE